MNLIVKNINTDDVTLDSLTQMQEAAFDQLYLKLCGHGLRETYGRCSIACAFEGSGRLIGYLLYAKPGDLAFDELIGEVERGLEWRKYLYEGGKNLASLFTDCQSTSGRTTEVLRGEFNFALPMIDDRAKRLLSANRDSDMVLGEIAVHPYYQNRGVARRLFTTMTRPLADGCSVYSYTRHTIRMYDIFRHWGFSPLFEYGPKFPDGARSALVGKLA